MKSRLYPVCSACLVLCCSLALGACGNEAKTNPTASNPAPQQESAKPTASAIDVATAKAALAVGSVAPAFELPGSDGQTHRLSDYAGQHVVLAFFPKAFTGG